MSAQPSAFIPRVPGDFIGPAGKLARLLGLDSVHDQGLHVASSSDYWDEYMARAEGRTPAKIAQPYWD